MFWKNLLLPSSWCNILPVGLRQDFPLTLQYLATSLHGSTSRKLCSSSVKVQGLIMIAIRQFMQCSVKTKMIPNWETGGILPGPLRGSCQGVNVPCRGAHINPIFHKKRNLVLLSFQIVSEILLWLHPTNCTTEDGHC
jgi:hypothetical protein